MCYLGKDEDDKAQDQDEDEETEKDGDGAENGGDDAVMDEEFEKLREAIRRYVDNKLLGVKK